MKCPLCNIEMGIGMTTTEVEGDTSPDEKTVVCEVQHMVCRNKKCLGWGKVQARVKHIRYQGK